ncbi:hypothetical protein K438DRAFT_1799588 [Mycena galopus ATCC 62051]|nr:hypothetical protein K438DRAFT_1799588 [Mycena galopus ATCC 62051]
MWRTPKPSLKLVAELRKLTEVSIVKAREALSASNNDITKAFVWLQNDLAASGAKKAEKLKDRTANEGLISVAVLSAGNGFGAKNAAVRAAMIELNCETDFVLKDAPLLSAVNPNPDPTATVGRAIQDIMSKVGEKVSLRRALTVFHEPPELPRGRIGVLSLLGLSSPKLHNIFASKEFWPEQERLERSLARQIVGFDTRSIRASANSPKDEIPLYDQPFDMLPGDLSGQPVGLALAAWAAGHGFVAEEGAKFEVEQFGKWTVGEPVEPETETGGI